MHVNSQVSCFLASHNNKAYASRTHSHGNVGGQDLRPAVRTAGRSGLVVARLPAVREGPGSNRAAGRSLCFHENHCDTQLWARAEQ